MQKKKIHLSLTKNKPRLGIEEHHGSPKETQSKQINIREKYLNSKTQKTKQMNKESYWFMDVRKWKQFELMRLPIDLIM